MVTLTKPSAQSLLIQMQFNGQPLSTGTAFVVVASSGPVLITNRHNVTGRDQESGKPLSPTGGVPSELLVWHNVKGKLGEWISRTEPLFNGQAPRWREHPVLGPKADFVALPLSQLQEVELYPHDIENLGPDIHVGPADPVSVIGFPFGLTGGGALGVWATGFLASEPEVNFANLPIQLIDCRTRQGQSGSPVIAYRAGGMVPMAGGGAAAFSGPVSRFIGVYSGRINAESDLGIVWKVAAIRELVRCI